MVLSLNWQRSKLEKIITRMGHTNDQKADDTVIAACVNEVQSVKPTQGKQTAELAE